MLGLFQAIHERIKTHIINVSPNVQFTFFDLYREHTLCVYLAGFKKKKNSRPAKLQH